MDLSPVTLLALDGVTLRALLAAGLSFLAAILLGSRVIGWLNRHFREPNLSPSDDIRQLHGAKQWTPTMGGLPLIAGLVVATLLLGNLENPYVPLALAAALALGAIGAADDLIKLSGRGPGLSRRTKFLAQTAVALVVALLLYAHQSQQPGGAEIFVPLVGRVASLGAWIVPLAALVIVGSSNAVNLTDGLDGLAGGCLLAAIGALGVVVYASGHAGWSAYLNVPHVPGAGELLVVLGAMAGGVLGFLWFNCHPAQVFMGDTGSLPLGGLLGLVAVIVRQEFLLVVIGGVFVVETLSVVAQVLCHRWTGRRIFRCAPLHHHFQLLGWPESKVVVRFWIAAVLAAVAGLAMLKSAGPQGQMGATPSIAVRRIDLRR